MHWRCGLTPGTLRCPTLSFASDKEGKKERGTYVPAGSLAEDPAFGGHCTNRTETPTGCITKPTDQTKTSIKELKS